MSTKISNAKIRVVNDPTVTEIYVSFKRDPAFNLSNGKFDIEFTPSAPETTPAADVKSETSEAKPAQPAEKEKPVVKKDKHKWADQV